MSMQKENIKNTTNCLYLQRTIFIKNQNFSNPAQHAKDKPGVETDISDMISVEQPTQKSFKAKSIS